MIKEKPRKKGASGQQNKLRIQTFAPSRKFRIHKLRGTMSNMYVLEQRRWWLRKKPGKLTLVDLGLPDETKALANYVEGINGNVHEIFLTHAHHDHIGDLKYAHKKFPNAVISSTLPANEAMDRKTSRMLKQLPTAVGLLLKKRSKLSVFARFLRSRFEGHGELTRLYDNGQALNSIKKFVVIETPGHTSHDASLYSRRYGVLLSGDTFVRSPGREITPLRLHAERPDLQEDTVSKVSKLKMSYFFPGIGSAVVAKNRKERMRLQDRITMPKEPKNRR